MGLNIPSTGGTSSGWRKTDWITAADITATGITTVDSAVMAIPFAGLEDFVEAIIEIRYTQLGNTGGASKTWGILVGQTSSFQANDTIPTDVFTPANYANEQARERRHLIKLNIFQSGLSYSTDRIVARVRTKGNDANSTSTVTNIRARLLYQKV